MKQSMETMDMANDTPMTHGMESFLENWEQRKELANTLLKSGFLPREYTTTEQVVAVMLKGAELGIPVMEALHGLSIVGGKPSLNPQLMLALVRRSGELEDLKIEYKDDACFVTVKRKDQSPHTTRFGTSEARALNLLGKEQYIRQPLTMYQWRALAANLRVTFPDVIGGFTIPEDLGLDVKVSEEDHQIVVDTESGAPVSEIIGELMPGEPPPPVVSAMAAGFDPTGETLTFGKYAGARWTEVPEDYLVWLKGNATNKDIAGKVDDTLRLRQANDTSSVRGAEVLHFTIGEEGTSIPGKEVSLFDLSNKLESVAARNNLQELDRWVEEQRNQIDSLPEEDKGTLRKQYALAVERAKEPGRTEVR